MELIDIHTHNKEASTMHAILCSPEYTSGRNISLGIHPWDIDNQWKEHFALIKEHAKERNVVAIGECGIDKLKSPASIEEQTGVLRAHAELAETSGKPLILHCVKTIDEILALHHSIKPRQAWIIHGFRGKPQQAAQLTAAGLQISLGEHFNKESAKSIPADRIFVESDTSSMPIEEIYAAIAAARGCSIEELAQQVRDNATRVFGAHIK